MSKRSNFDIKEASYLHIVHILQHPTSCPTTMSTKTTMVNAQKKNFSQRLAGRNRKSTKLSIQQHYSVDEGQSGLGAERIGALG
jgi:hypothetical protein